MKVLLGLELIRAFRLGGSPFAGNGLWSYLDRCWLEAYDSAIRGATGTDVPATLWSS